MKSVGIVLAEWGRNRRRKEDSGCRRLATSGIIKRLVYQQFGERREPEMNQLGNLRMWSQDGDAPWATVCP